MTAKLLGFFSIGRRAFVITRFNAAAQPTPEAVGCSGLLVVSLRYCDLCIATSN
jgi:hypothetical protein